MKKTVLSLLIGLLVLSGCAKAAYDKEDLDKAVLAIKEVYGENYYPSNKMDATLLEEIVKVKAEDVIDFYAEGPMMSFQVDTLIVIIAKEGKIEEVKKALEDYEYYLEHDAFNYPMNMPKINASQVIVKGNIVAFVLLGKADERLEASEAEYASYAQAQVQLGVDALLEVLK
jgi:hypothetical protein